MTLNRKLELTKISQAGIKKIAEKNTDGSCCSILDSESPDEEVCKFRTKFSHLYGGYSSCVSNVGFLLYGTKFYKNFEKDLAAHNMGCKNVRYYVQKALLLSSGLMDTE